MVAPGLGGADTLLGFAGNDALIFDAGDANVNGGADTDTLRFIGAGGVLNLTLAAGATVFDIEIVDLAGDGDHYKAIIASAAFSGKTRVAQHQLVYAALKGRMGGVLHALALETKVK